jgi:hypothetical protein
VRSDKQKETSRRNGAKSHGPVTDAGKQQSAKNASKHYITSKALIIPGESGADLDTHFAAYHQRFRPTDQVERDAVDNLAFTAWRLRRLWGREAILITTACDTRRDLLPERGAPPRTPTEAWRRLANGPALVLLQREEAGLRRAYDHTLKNLRDLQSSRPVQNEPDGGASFSSPALQNEPEPLAASPAAPDHAAHPEPEPPPAATPPVVLQCSNQSFSVGGGTCLSCDSSSYSSCALPCCTHRPPAAFSSEPSPINPAPRLPEPV